MQQRQMELVKPIMDQIRKVLDDIRQEDGYAFILDAGSEAGVIVAADRNLDITEKVIARLKPRHSVGAVERQAGQSPSRQPVRVRHLPE